MRPAVLTIAAVLVCSIAPAFADDVVLPPLGNTSDAAPVSAALSTTKGLRRASKTVDASCAGDPGCLAKAGTELNATRIVVVTATGHGNLDVVVVDVGEKLMLGTRTIKIPAKKLGKELGPALAKLVDDLTTEKAKALFAEGNEHYNLGELAPALDRYKLAYRVKPLPAFQFNIAQCYRKLGQYKDAVTMYQAYLVGVPDADNKAMVDSLIAESKKGLADQNAAAAALEHDKLTTEQKKAEEARKAREAEAAATAERARAEQAKVAAERERGYNRHPARKYAILTGLVGLGTAGAGAYFGVQARDLQSKFDEAGCGDPTQTRLEGVLSQCVSDRDRGKRDAFLTNVLVGSGAAVVLTAVLVFAIDPGNLERPDAPRVGLGVSPTSLKVMVLW
jgi:hypothetical protein